MATPTSSITDLPLDVLVLVWPYLDAKSFLSLCSTCRAFQQASIRLDPAYWSFVTRSTFRLPNQPVVQHDGAHWQKMYRRLLTQSRVFTWGSNTRSRLGHSYAEPIQNRPLMPRVIRPRRSGPLIHCSSPIEMEDTRTLGVIVDMQCGGWSTTLLTAKGSLHTVGVLDGERVYAASGRLQTLEFPTNHQTSSADAQYEEPAFAIRQFSSGRKHILAISDSGRIWSWYHAKKPALHIKFGNIDILEPVVKHSYSEQFTQGRVKQVVAGWNRSSAYISGSGIVVWHTVERNDGEENSDTMLVMEHAEVPETSYQRIKHARGESEELTALGNRVGAVLNYVILEHFVVFVTDIGKVFCGRFGEKNRVTSVLELRALRNDPGTPLDVQGSFRRFAVFKGNEVITSDQSYLDSCWNGLGSNSEQTDMAGLHRIPALQNNDVISVAFGDYHYLALHSNGKITSYGKELQACGALGLGSEADGEGITRGIVYDAFSHNGQLLPHAYTRGRQVWFDNRKKSWIDHLMQGGKHPEEANERMNLFRTSHNVQGEVSEWVEQESRAFDNNNTGEDGLGAHFVLTISAAGWHSGALVLVNEDIEKCQPSEPIEDQSFPRLRLADGTEMPGTKDFDDWREGRPAWELDNAS